MAKDQVVVGGSKSGAAVVGGSGEAKRTRCRLPNEDDQQVTSS